MTTIAAVADVHIGGDVAGRYRPMLQRLPEQADLLLLAGDLTRHGTEEEAAYVAAEFGDLGVPVVAVLGNHDYQSGTQDLVAGTLTSAGLTVLEGSAVTLDCGGMQVGIAGVKGFGGGFAGRCATSFGEPEMKAFVGETERSAGTLEAALRSLTADVRIALTHYAPIPETLAGEPPEIYPFLGAYQLGEAIDRAGATLAIHGHAHYGTRAGTTPGGVPVRNVAYPVLRSLYAMFRLEPHPAAMATSPTITPPAAAPPAGG